MNLDEINKILDEKEEFILSVKQDISIGMAHIAVTLATIKKDLLFRAVAKSWKDYIIQDRTQLGYEHSIRLARIGNIYLTFREQLEENGIKLSKNMSKMDLFDEEIASKDPRFYDMFKRLSYRALSKYIKNYKDGSYTVYSGETLEVPMVAKGASLFIGEKKLKGFNLNEAREKVAAGKRAVVIWVDDDNEARRVRRRVER